VTGCLKLGGHWFDTALNVHAPTEDGRATFKRNCSMHIQSIPEVLPTIRNESSREISKDNGVRVVYYTSKNLIVTRALVPHHNS
jgi:hypothetical protein